MVSASPTMDQSLLSLANKEILIPLSMFLQDTYKSPRHSNGMMITCNVSYDRTHRWIHQRTVCYSILFNDRVFVAKQTEEWRKKRRNVGWLEHGTVLSNDSATYGRSMCNVRGLTYDVCLFNEQPRLPNTHTTTSHFWTEKYSTQIQIKKWCSPMLMDGIRQYWFRVSKQKCHCCFTPRPLFLLDPPADLTLFQCRANKVI